MGKTKIDKENFTINNTDTERLYLKCGNHQTYNSNTENNGEGNQKLKRNQIFLLLGMSSINFFVSTNLSLPGPFFPGEAAKKGSTPTITGFIFGSFPLMTSIFSPIFGYFASRIGVRFMYITGCLVCGTCSVLFGFLDKCPDGVTFIVLCLVCRSISGIGAAGFYTAIYMIIAEQFENHIGKVYGIVEALYAVGLMVGPPVGGALFDFGGFALPFVAVGCIVVMNCLLCGCLVPASKDVIQTKTDGSVTRLLRSPPFLVVGFNIFVVVFCVALLEPVFEPHLRKFGLSALNIGLLFLVDSVTYGITMVICGWVVDKKNSEILEMLIILTAAILGFVSYMVLGPAPFLNFIPFNVWIVVISLCFVGVCCGCCFGTAFKHLIDKLKKDDLFQSTDSVGIVSGYLQFCTSSGALLGPVLGGIIADFIGFKWEMFFCSGLFLLLGFSILVYIIKDRCSYKTIKEGNVH